MAIFHFSAQVLGRGSPRTKRVPRSSVCAAAYDAGERLVDRRTGVVYDFRRKRAVVRSAILLPVGAPAWAENRETLWNAVELRERRSDAVTARELVVALPRELTHAQREKLVRAFLLDHLVALGMAVDYAMHEPDAADGETQPHCHALLTMRPFVGDGFGLKARAWNARSLLHRLRAEWAKVANAALVEAGFPDAATLDHRSHRARLLSVRPTIHEGRRGAGDRRAINDAIRRSNSIAAELVTLESTIADLEAQRDRRAARREAAIRRLARATQRHKSARSESARTSLAASASTSAGGTGGVSPVQLQSVPAGVAGSPIPTPALARTGRWAIAVEPVPAVQALGSNRIGFIEGDRETILLALRVKDAAAYRLLQQDRGQAASAAIIATQVLLDLDPMTLFRELRPKAAPILRAAKSVVGLSAAGRGEAFRKIWPAATVVTPQNGALDWEEERRVAFDAICDPAWKIDPVPGLIGVQNWL